MKIYTHITVLLMVIFIISGCFDHSDEVDYQTYNVLTISDEKANMGTGDEVLIEAYRHREFSLTPTVTQSIFEDDLNLKYRWQIRGNSDPQGDYEYEELGTTKDLNIELTAPVGLHRIIYTVTDTVTGVSKYLYYDVHVLSDFSKGWVILEETSNGGDLAMLVPTSEGKDRIYRNIYSIENGKYLKNPVGVLVCNYSKFDKIFVYTQDEGYEVTREEFSEVVNLDSWFVSGAQPDSYNLQLMDMANYTWYGIINDGKYHLMNRTGASEGTNAYFVSALQGPTVTDEHGDKYTQDYDLAPFAVSPCSAMAYGDISRRHIVYDNLYKRFMYVNAGDWMIPSFGLYGYDSSKDAWNPDDVGLEMLHIDRNNPDDGGNNDKRKNFTYNAIMKDEQGKLYLLRLEGRAGILIRYEGNNPVTYSLPISKDVLPDALRDFSVAASSTIREHMYIAAGNVIYHYDILGKSLSQQYTFGGSEKPVCMRTMANDGDETLIVATYDGTHGKVYYFTIEATGKVSQTVEPEIYEGFGKILDMQYKELL